MVRGQEKKAEPVTSDDELDRYLGYTINFGKYKGKSYGWILDNDKQYFRWVIRNMNVYTKTFKVLGALATEEDRNAAMVKCANKVTKIQQELKR